jgi:hypothetical protein
MASLSEQGEITYQEEGESLQFLEHPKHLTLDDLVKSLSERHPGESRGPEHLEITGFRLSPE